MTKDFFGSDKKRYKFTAKANVEISLRINVKGLNINDINKRLTTAINRASARITRELKDTLDKAILSNVWPTIAGTADIYDTGKLLQSGKVLVSGNGITIIYDAPYAALVHYGGYVVPYGNASAEKVYLPPRPWVEAVLNGGGPVPKFDFVSLYKEEIEREFR